MDEPATTRPSAASAVYQERLHVPLRWWVQGTMLVASFWLALFVALQEYQVAVWVITAVSLAALVTALRSYGGLRVIVTDDVLRVGVAHLERRYWGPATALDPGETRRVAGIEADARAYLALRPYLKRAVRLAVTDPEDPAPYWLVSTRDPDRLAAALNRPGETASGLATDTHPPGAPTAG